MRGMHGMHGPWGTLRQDFLTVTQGIHGSDSMGGSTKPQMHSASEITSEEPAVLRMTSMQTRHDGTSP